MKEFQTAMCYGFLGSLIVDVLVFALTGTLGAPNIILTTIFFIAGYGPHILRLGKK